MLFFQNNEEQKLEFILELERIFQVRPATQEDAIHAKSQDIQKMQLALYGVEGETSSHDDPETLALEGALARERATLQPQLALSASVMLIVFHGQVFLRIRYHTATNCELCAKSLSDLISPQHALECKRCNMKMHREQRARLHPAKGALGTKTLTLPVGQGAASGNQPSIDFCKVASVNFKSLLMMLSSPREQKNWIAQLTKRIPKHVASNVEYFVLKGEFINLY